MYKITGGKNRLLKLIKSGSSLCFFKEGNKISYEIGLQFSCNGTHKYNFDNIYNCKTLKDAQDILNNLQERFDYIK